MFLLNSRMLESGMAASGISIYFQNQGGMLQETRENLNNYMQQNR